MKSNLNSVCLHALAKMILNHIFLPKINGKKNKSKLVITYLYKDMQTILLYWSNEKNTKKITSINPN